MGSSTHETNGNSKDRSDLTQIRGIGVVRKRWLNGLGIATIADLAQASADAIEAQAKHEGRTLSRDELEEWIAQAQVHHVQASLEQAEPSPMADAIAAAPDPTPQARGQAAAEADPEADPELSPWQSFASFQVNYQTRQVNGRLEQRLVAHHLETDEMESWANFETDLIQQWMGDRLRVTLPSPHAESSPETALMMAEITQLRVLQPDWMRLPMVADKNNPIFSEAIHRAEPFALEVSMQFAGLPKTPPKHQLAYRVQCLTRHLATGETDSLGDVTAQVSPSEDATYTVLLPPLKLLEPGIYRLKVLVTPQQASAVLGQFKVPMLEVI